MITHGVSSLLLLVTHLTMYAVYYCMFKQTESYHSGKTNANVFCIKDKSYRAYSSYLYCTHHIQTFNLFYMGRAGIRNGLYNSVLSDKN